MKTTFFATLALSILLTVSLIAGETVKETTFKVSGNCGMCKTRIEKAMKIPEVKFAKWDKKSKMLKVAYLADAVTVDSLQKRISSVGHDTEKFTAETSVYENLPGCCLYRDGVSDH
ncbi:MAG: ATPase [Bacteroidetes bacterium]|nr:ATPase [Bacteroidota bacterium]